MVSRTGSHREPGRSAVLACPSALLTSTERLRLISRQCLPCLGICYSLC